MWLIMRLFVTCIFDYAYACRAASTLTVCMSTECWTQHTVYKQICFFHLNRNSFGNTHCFFKESFTRKKRRLVSKQIRRKALRLQILPVSPDHTLLKVGGAEIGTSMWFKCSHLLFTERMGNCLRFRMGASITSSAPLKCKVEVSMLTKCLLFLRIMSLLLSFSIFIYL